MSKVNSKSTGNGSVQNSSAGGQTTKHQRRAQRNSHAGAAGTGGGGGADHMQLTADLAAVDRSSVRDYAGTVASHSQPTTAPRRADHQLLYPSSRTPLYENTYRIEPQASLSHDATAVYAAVVT